MDTTHLSRRRFLLNAGGAALSAGALLPGLLAHGADRRKPRVLFHSRSGAFEHAVVRREGGRLSVGEQLMVEMGGRIGVEVECAKDGGVFDGDLDRFDAFVLYWNLDPMTPNARDVPPVTQRGKDRFLEAVAAGKGVLGIHCASYAFLSGDRYEWQPPERRDPYVKMLGGELCAAHGVQKIRQRIVSPGFPGVDKLKTPVFEMVDEPYGLKNFADDIHVIAVLETEGLAGVGFQRPPFPSLWARRHGEGRVLYTVLGHDEAAWRSEPFQHIVVGGLEWVLGRVDAEVPPNLAAAAPEASKLP